MRKAVKIGFIGVFCAVIGLAFPVFNIFSKQLSMDSHENRLMTRPAAGAAKPAAGAAAQSRQLSGR